jgi:hypothetical protein
MLLIVQLNGFFSLEKYNSMHGEYYCFHFTGEEADVPWE